MNDRIKENGLSEVALREKGVRTNTTLAMFAQVTLKTIKHFNVLETDKKYNQLVECKLAKQKQTSI